MSFFKYFIFRIYEFSGSRVQIATAMADNTLVPSQDGENNSTQEQNQVQNGQVNFIK